MPRVAAVLQRRDDARHELRAPRVVGVDRGFQRLPVALLPIRRLLDFSMR